MWKIRIFMKQNSHENCFCKFPHLLNENLGKLKFLECKKCFLGFFFMKQNFMKVAIHMKIVSVNFS